MEYTYKWYLHNMEHENGRLDIFYFDIKLY